jgi:hypothetical protein
MNPEHPAPLDWQSSGTINTGEEHAREATVLPTFGFISSL